MHAHDREHEHEQEQQQRHIRHIPDALHHGGQQHSKGVDGLGKLQYSQETEGPKDGSGATGAACENKQQMCNEMVRTAMEKAGKPTESTRETVPMAISTKLSNTTTASKSLLGFEA